MSGWRWLAGALRSAKLVDETQRELRGEEDERERGKEDESSRMPNGSFQLGFFKFFFLLIQRVKLLPCPH